MRTEEQIAADAEERSPFSNGTEYDMWADRWCYRCRRDDAETETYCPILSVALLGGGWPKEWTRHYVKFGAFIKEADRFEVSETTADDPDGCAFVDTCTEFEERRDNGGDPEPEPEPPPVIDGQVDMFEVFADRIAEQSLQPEQVSA
jgi:hypothetical protein